MTDKQIIIDGVDVSGCTYSKIGIDKKIYCEQDLYDDGTPVFTCDECTNCYYKQLKRKEQECERLKHDNDYEVGALEKTIDNLTAECEMWKNQVLTIDDETITAQITQRQFDEYNQLKAENEELKNCLDEIKEIANYSFNRSTSEYMAKLELILEKISEVENDNET